jgi:hypothetical protein
MTDADPSKLRRIRALLNLAECASTPGPGDEREATSEEERADALEMAMRLMALYGIERAHLAALDPTSDPIDGTWVDLAEPYGAAKGHLMNRVAGPLRCRTLLYQVGRGNKRISVVGAASDRERTIMLYTSLLVQCATEVSRIKGGTAGRSRSLRNAFMYGYANRIHERLQEFEKRTVDETSDPTGTALVLVDRATLVD